jgi:hypothetical protein
VGAGQRRAAPGAGTTTACTPSSSPRRQDELREVRLGGFEVPLRLRRAGRRRPRHGALPPAAGQLPRLGRARPAGCRCRRCRAAAACLPVRRGPDVAVRVGRRAVPADQERASRSTRAANHVEDRQARAGRGAALTDALPSGRLVPRARGSTRGSTRACATPSDLPPRPALGGGRPGWSSGGLPVEVVAGRPALNRRHKLGPEASAAEQAAAAARGQAGAACSSRLLWRRGARSCSSVRCSRGEPTGRTSTRTVIRCARSHVTYSCRRARGPQGGPGPASF